MNAPLFFERASRHFDLHDEVDWSPRPGGGHAFFEVVLTSHRHRDGAFHLLRTRIESGLSDDGGGDDPIEWRDGQDQVLWHVPDSVAIRKAVGEADAASEWLKGQQVGEA